MHETVRRCMKFMMVVFKVMTGVNDCNTWSSIVSFSADSETDTLKTWWRNQEIKTHIICNYAPLLQKQQLSHSLKCLMLSGNTSMRWNKEWYLNPPGQSPPRWSLKQYCHMKSVRKERNKRLCLRQFLHAFRHFSFTFSIYTQKRILFRCVRCRKMLFFKYFLYLPGLQKVLRSDKLLLWKSSFC